MIHEHPMQKICCKTIKLQPYYLDEWNKHVQQKGIEVSFRVGLRRANFKEDPDYFFKRMPSDENSMVFFVNYDGLNAGESTTDQGYCKGQHFEPEFNAFSKLEKMYNPALWKEVTLVKESYASAWFFWIQMENPDDDLFFPTHDIRTDEELKSGVILQKTEFVKWLEVVTEQKAARIHTFVNLEDLQMC